MNAECLGDGMVGGVPLLLGSWFSSAESATFVCRRYCYEIRNIFQLHPTILRIGYAEFRSRIADFRRPPISQASSHRFDDRSSK